MSVVSLVVVKKGMSTTSLSLRPTRHRDHHHQHFAASLARLLYMHIQVNRPRLWSRHARLLTADRIPLMTTTGEKELPGITDVSRPRRLGPKRATKIRALFALEKSDNVVE